MSASLRSLADVARAQADLTALLGSGGVFGEIGERVAARVTGSHRISGTGNDLSRPAPSGWRRPDPLALVGSPAGAEEVDAETLLEGGAKTRFDKWVARSDRQLGEVKARQLDRRFSDAQLLDTRSAGPRATFCPLVDFYVFLLFGLDGSVRKCLEVPRPELLDYVASDVGRGGRWNYKVSIGISTDIGIDRTEAAQDAMRVLEALPESKAKDV